MNRWLLVVGFVVAVYLLAQFSEGKYTVDDVLKIVVKPDVVEENVETPETKASIKYFKPVINRSRFYENIFAAITDKKPFEESPLGLVTGTKIQDLREAAKFLTRLKETREVATFVVIAENPLLIGNDKIFTSRYGYETPLGNLQPDLELIESLNLDTMDLAVMTAYPVRDLAPLIKKTFPDAKIVPVVLGDSSEESIAALAGQLSAQKNIFAIAAASFSTNNFQREMIESQLKSFDVRVDENDVLALMKYLEKLDARRVTLKNNLAIYYEGKPVEERALTILAFGDMMLGRYVRTMMNRYGLDYIFEKMPAGFIGDADVVFGNLEGPIKGEGKSGGTAMNFSFNEDVAPLLKRHGFNLLSVANNHAVDQGWIGRDTTTVALDASGLGWCGHPSEADPASVYYGSAGDKKFAFVCFHDVNFKLDDEAAVKLVREVGEKVDYAIVSIHWGYEYKHKPDWKTQIEPGRAFVDAGADFVIGHHPHVVQSFEIYNGKPIFYSLGNFVFDQYWSKDTQEELALGIVLQKNFQKIYLFPMKSELSQSHLMTERERSEWIERFIGYGDYDEEMKTMIRSGLIEIRP